MMAAPKDNEKIRKLRAVIEEQNIDFRGVQPNSEWPWSHASLFQKIFDVDRIWYGEFLQSGGLTSMEKEKLKRQVDQVVRAANSCRRDLDIESTWRRRIETYITDRFERETNCKKCSRVTLGHGARYLSIPAFEPHEYDSRPRIRQKCGCKTPENYEDRFETGEVNIFNIKADSKVLYFNHDLLRSNGAPEIKPDCMIGLAVTESMKKCLAHSRSLRHYPFMDQNHRQMVYPFLLIEAKSEKGNPGFERIEAQGALPVQMMLQLQLQFSEAEEHSINPLVWFIAYAGCDFRFYGCVHTLAGFQIFELWHGSLCYHDKVFRLFYILDLICDWAREYRRVIQSSLVSDKQLLREWTPASTILASQDAMHNVSASIDTSQHPSAADEQLLELHISDDRVSPTDLAMGMSESESDEESAEESYIEHRELFYDFSGQSHNVVLRHIDTAKFHFRHAILPDRGNWNSSDAETSRLRQMIRYALTEGSFLPLSNDSVKAIEIAWLGSNPSTIASYLKAEHLCLVKLDTFFDSDLLPVKSLSCVSMSTALLKSIIVDEPIPIPVPEASTTSIQHAEHLIKDFIAMARSLSRRDSIHACLLRLRYHLVPGRASSSEEQRRYSNLFGDPSGMKTALFNFIDDVCEPDLHQHSMIRTLFPGQRSAPISAPKTFGTREHIVVGPSEWMNQTQTSPNMVVLIASDDIYDSNTIRQRLQRIMRTILNHKDVYRAKDAMDLFFNSQPSEGIAITTCSDTLELATKFFEHVKQSVQLDTSGVEAVVTD